MSALSKPFCQLVLEIFGHLTGSQVGPESTRPESMGLVYFQSVQETEGPWDGASPGSLLCGP